MAMRWTAVMRCSRSRRTATAASRCAADGDSPVWTAQRAAAGSPAAAALASSVQARTRSVISVERSVANTSAVRHQSSRTWERVWARAGVMRSSTAGTCVPEMWSATVLPSVSTVWPSSSSARKWCAGGSVGFAMGLRPSCVRVRIKAWAGVDAPARAAFWSVFLPLSDRMLLSRGKVFQPVRLDRPPLVLWLVPGSDRLVVSGIASGGPVMRAGCSAGRVSGASGGGAAGWWLAGGCAGGVLAAGGVGGHLVGGCGQQAGLPLALGGQDAGGAVRVEVQDGPELAEPVQGVQAQGMVFPAGREDGGELAVAGLVDLADPGAEPVQRGVAFWPGELPPSWRRDRQVASRVLGVVAVAGDVGEMPGEGGDLLVEPVQQLRDHAVPGEGAVS